MDRRSLLLGLGASGAALRPLSAAQLPASSPTPPPARLDRQAGVVTPQQPAGLVAAFDVLAADQTELARLLQVLTERIATLTAGGPIARLDPGLPPPDSGLLGADISMPDLTITLSVGASLFDHRFGLAERKPRHLTTMPRFPNDSPDPTLCHGDLLLQICSGLPEANIHALRDVIRHTPDLLAVRWKMEGFMRTRPDPTRPRETPRNMLGFKDGTANPDAADSALMDQLVWVQPGSGEPDWAVGGSYQVVRVIRTMVERWDRTPLREQQSIFGRDKMSGAPLGQSGEHDEPDFNSDPVGRRIPLDAHIRLANPRTPAATRTRILRRGYNFSRGLTPAGQLDMGLLFICYQADLQAGFAAIQNRLNGEALEEYVKPIGGGYFFALPGVGRDGVLGAGLLASL